MTQTMPASPVTAASTFEARVIARRNIAATTTVLTLGAIEGGTPLPDWSAGAHIDVHTPYGVRNYSLCGPADDATWQIAVLRADDGAGGSRWLHDTVVPGDVLRLGGPRNTFPLEPARSYLFVAGGIGITPLLPLSQRADELGKPWRLIHTARTPADLTLCAERPADERVTLWCSEAGRLDLACEMAALGPEDLVYCCGSEDLMAAVVDMAQAAGVGVRTERFGPVTREDDQAFTLAMAKSGRELTVPADRSALDVLNEAGFLVPSSCRSGICGTCETAVVSGEIDHRDEVLTEEERAENTCMFPCVSRARGERVVLDL